jgi:hypothetical protein
VSKVLEFGEKVDEYDVRVLNEREIRAGAGILFLFAMISFLNSWLIGDFSVTRIFVTIFLFDFFIRVFINPKYAPSLILGRFAVRNQQVEYVGASQKRFAWGVGFGLALLMFYLIVIQNVIGPLNLLVCLVCLGLLFFESAFGVCLACGVYNLFHAERAKLCPGNNCELEQRVTIQKVSLVQLIVVVLFMGLLFVVSNTPLISEGMQVALEDEVSEVIVEEKDCTVPEFAIAMGHEEKWKLHNGCTDKVSEVIVEEKDCTVPEFAIAMGHQEKWKLHNGCD